MWFRILLLDVYADKNGNLTFVEFEEPAPEGTKWVGWSNKVIRTDKEVDNEEI